MASNKLTTYIIIFNLLMSLFLFFSSAFVLFVLNGKIVQDVGIYIEYGFPATIGGPIPTVHAPLLNYPLFAFIFTLIGNVILTLRLRRENKAIILSKNSS